ncbi:hypothetical protein ACWEH3_28290 [Nocardia sp. NPDC004718]
MTGTSERLGRLVIDAVLRAGETEIVAVTLDIARSTELKERGVED